MTCPRNPVFIQSTHRNGQEAAAPVPGCLHLDFRLLSSHTLIRQDRLPHPLLILSCDIDTGTHTQDRPWFNFGGLFLVVSAPKRIGSHKKTGCESTSDRPREIG